MGKSTVPKLTCIRQFLFIALAGSCLGADKAADSGVVIKLDASETPELQAWGEQVQKLSLEWYPRICNILPSKGFTAPQSMQLTIRRSNQGIAATSGTNIVVSSHWIEKHPDDVGLVVHELVHVAQQYPRYDPMWLTEGIADYVRWAIFEGKPQSYFPRSQRRQGYKEGYQAAAGFLLWLETDRAPGIVNKLNAAMRNREYSEELFKVEAGRPLDELWQEYVAPLPPANEAKSPGE